MRARSPFPAPALAVLSAAMLLAPVGDARAGWPNDPTVNVPVCIMGGTQAYEAVVADGAGGAIVGWSDLRAGSLDIYAQRLGTGGEPLWTINGVPLCQAAGGQYLNGAVPDGAGGAILVWEDLRGGTSDIYAQRVNANGAAMWTPDGVALCIATGGQSYPRVEADGAGGAVFTWLDPRNGNIDVYAQRVNASGATLWTPDGVAVCVATGNQDNVRLVADGTGGTIVAWNDPRSGTPDIYAQRIGAAGAALWAADGVVVCNATNAQYAPRPVADGAGGAVMIWQDYRAGNYDLYAQRINSSGAAQWAANGILVCGAAGSQSMALAVTDRAGGLIAVWNDARSAVADLYAQRVLASGSTAWTTDGIPVCASSANEIPSALVPADGVEGAIVAWRDDRTGNQDLYVQRIQQGDVAWASGGVALSTYPTSPAGASIASDGAGGVIGAWTDTRGLLAQDIWAQRVDGFGQRGAQPVITSARDMPNDQGGRVKLAWSASPADAYPDWLIDEYWVLRSVPPQLAAEAVARGARVLRDAADMPVAGVRNLLFTSNEAAEYAWEYVGSQPAFHVTSYSYVVATTCDSLPGSNPVTMLMVMARTAGGSAWWFSDPDSGWSVDNLAPATPAPFEAAWGAGSTALRWGSNSEPDLAGYRLWRGGTADFVPDEASFVADVTDTIYLDPADRPFWYRVAAVDVHGNAGATALVLPAGATGAPPGGSYALALLGPAPNPLRDATVVRWSLSRAGPARLAVLDVAGRRMRSLEHGVFEPGPHATSWDGRDDAGREVPAGIYLLMLEAEGRTLRERAVRIR